MCRLSNHHTTETEDQSSREAGAVGGDEFGRAVSIVFPSCDRIANILGSQNLNKLYYQIGLSERLVEWRFYMCANIFQPIDER